MSIKALKETVFRDIKVLTTNTIAFDRLLYYMTDPLLIIA
jgi:hypothetical protein